MAERIPINNRPNVMDLWKGIAGHFDSFDQILCEFIDNAISNFVGNGLATKTIIITIAQQPDRSAIVSIEDSGTGIRNLDAAFSLGCMDAGDTPLNEHGFGMKHALASANPTNNDWRVCTRTRADFEQGVFTKIESGYEIEDFTASRVSLTEEQWPGELNGSGTFVRFHATWDLMYTLRKGITGSESHFNRLMTILAEDLGFIYAGLIQDNSATISIRATDQNGNNTSLPVVAILPSWSQFYAPSQGTERFDLGGGNVEIRYSFGAVSARDGWKYYKKNMSSSGLEVRLNGRVLAYNLFKEVWRRERHNMYNHLLVLVNIVSSRRESLPTTRTSKNGLREGDGKLESLYDWVRRKMPDPPRDTTQAHDEQDLFEILERQKLSHIPDPKVVTTEQRVFTEIGAPMRADMYVHYQDQAIVYEGKKDSTSVQDVYQLKMYWDGAASDGLRPTKGILIATSHPEPVLNLITSINENMRDINGQSYALEAKTWRSENVDFPQ